MSFLNKKLFHSRNIAFGIDISDLSVKVVKASDDGNKIRVKSFGSSSLPAEAISDGNIIKKEEVVLAIKEAVKNSKPRKIKSKKVICSLPETKAFLRIISVPSMKEEELKEAIKWEIEANIPLEISQVYYDWKVLDERFAREKGRDSVLMIAVSKDVVDQFVEVLEEADLEPVGMEIESIAQARSLISDKSGSKTTLIVDLGGRRTSFLVLIGDIPCFTSSLPVAGRSLSDAMAKTLELSFEEAEKMKIQYGIGSYVKRDPIFRSVEPVLKNIVGEIEKTIDFYTSELGYSKSIDQIILCGGAANTKGIIPYLSTELKREILLGDPWTNFGKDEKVHMIERKKSVKYSTALGLSLRGLKSYE